MPQGDRHGQSKKARCGAQEEFETQQGKRQACAQTGGETGAEKDEVEGQAHRSEREEACSQEEAVTAADGNSEANRNDTNGRDRRARSRRGRCYGARVGSESDLHFDRRPARAWRSVESCWHVAIV